MSPRNTALDLAAAAALLACLALPAAQAQPVGGDGPAAVFPADSAAPRLPAVSIVSPLQGALFNASFIHVSGSAEASDGHALALVRVRVNAGSWASAAGLGDWSVPVTLGAGPNLLEAQSIDEAGNASASASVSVSLDNMLPVISSVTVFASLDSATVAWTTDKAATSEVHYGRTSAYGQALPLTTALLSDHSAALSGLTPATSYHYKVWSRDAAGNTAFTPDLTFTTASPGGPAPPPQGPAPLSPPAPAEGSSRPAAAAQPKAAPADDARAKEKFLSPALQDGINDAAVFGPSADQVHIYDIRGRLVFSATRQGSTPIAWNCRDSSNRIVESGVYIARIAVAGSGSIYQSFAVVK